MSAQPKTTTATGSGSPSSAPQSHKYAFGHRWDGQGPKPTMFGQELPCVAPGSDQVDPPAPPPGATVPWWSPSRYDALCVWQSEPRGIDLVFRLLGSPEEHRAYARARRTAKLQARLMILRDADAVQADRNGHPKGLPHVSLAKDDHDRIARAAHVLATAKELIVARFPGLCANEPRHQAAAQLWRKSYVWSACAFHRLLIGRDIDYLYKSLIPPDGMEGTASATRAQRLASPPHDDEKIF